MSYDAESYPEVAEIAENKFKEIPTDIFLKMLNYTIYAMAKEDARYVFNGMYFLCEENKSNIVTTDGRRLSMFNSNIENIFPIPNNEGIIVPFKTIREIHKLVTDEQIVSMAYDSVDKRVFFKFKETVLNSKLIDGTFPDYKQVVPRNVLHEVKINKLDFDNNIREVAVMAAEPSKQVKFTFSQNNISIYSNTPDLGEAQNNLKIEYSGEDIEVAFNSRYILEVLKVIESEEIIFGITSNTSPTIIKSTDESEFLSIIMPMKV